MARVYVDQLFVDEESNESGNDDVYMVVFRGNTTAPFKSNVEVYGPGNLWDDLETGDHKYKDVNIAQYRSDAVYVVMLIEEDNDRDLSGSDVIGMFKSQTDLIWKAQMFALLGVKPGPAKEKQRQKAAQAIIKTLEGLTSIFLEFPKGNDDVIAAHRINPKPGDPDKKVFEGDGGKYEITFKVA